MTHALASRQGESLALQGETGMQPEVFLTISRLPAQDPRAIHGHAELLVAARCRRDAPLVTAPQLRQAFGFTATESAVAAALVAGLTPDEYARGTHLSMATVRTQLRAIYEKTGARSRAEAVGIMLWLPAQKLAASPNDTPETLLPKT